MRSKRRINQSSTFTLIDSVKYTISVSKLNQMNLYESEEDNEEINKKLMNTLRNVITSSNSNNLSKSKQEVDDIKEMVSK